MNIEEACDCVVWPIIILMPDIESRLETGVLCVCCVALHSDAVAPAR